MRFKTISIVGLVFALAISIIPAWGRDFSTYTNEELAAMRGTMRNAPAEDHAVFRKEWQNRLQTMTAEERRKYMERPGNAPADETGYRTNAPERGGGMNQKGSNPGGGYQHQYREQHRKGKGRN